tara:strand:- start:185 stop:328 length:144 start_codon:yes stop_codon:yes gene_type:complete
VVRNLVELFEESPNIFGKDSLALASLAPALHLPISHVILFSPQLLDV